MNTNIMRLEDEEEQEEGEEAGNVKAKGNALFRDGNYLGAAHLFRRAVDLTDQVRWREIVNILS